MKNLNKIYLWAIGILCVLSLIACVLVFSTKPQADTIPEPTVVLESTSEPTETAIPLISEPRLFPELFSYEFDSLDSAEQFIVDVAIALDILAGECNADRYTIDAINAMQAEIDRLCIEQSSAITQKEQFLLWEAKETEYPYATKTWKYLKDLGYSDVACAGIIGNLMAECGGHTLKLDPYIDDTNGQYYGMFQWSAKYYPAVVGTSFEEQLDFYAKTSEPIFKTWGKNYASGFTIDDFNRLTDPREAALAFAKIYERCASWTYERRQNFSEIAYQYFVLDFENL
jgi:hypothetical protein